MLWASQLKELNGKKTKQNKKLVGIRAHLEGEREGTASRVLTVPLLLKLEDLHHCSCEQVGNGKGYIKHVKEKVRVIQSASL